MPCFVPSLSSWNLQHQHPKLAPDPTRPRLRDGTCMFSAQRTLCFGGRNVQKLGEASSQPLIFHEKQLQPSAFFTTTTGPVETTYSLLHVLGHQVAMSTSISSGLENLLFILSLSKSLSHPLSISATRRTFTPTV